MQFQITEVIQCRFKHQVWQAKSNGKLLDFEVCTWMYKAPHRLCRFVQSNVHCLGWPKRWSRRQRKLRTCSSKVNCLTSSLALSVGLSNEKIFFPAMSSSDGEFSSGVVAGVSDGVSSVTGCTWIVACLKSICRRSPSVGLAVPRLIVAIVLDPIFQMECWILMPSWPQDFGVRVHG